MLKKTGLLILAVLLALAVTLGALAEPAEAVETADAAGLPAVGDTVEGFTVKEVRDFPLIGAKLVLFEHDATGMQLMYIANDDNNRVFDLSFATRATNDKGLPHVFEHATLSGSDKYPSKTIFFNLSYQTYNTYMNASTYNFMTCYPVASLSEAQLLVLADFYTDSCLHPSILKDESIFREEAWRYRMMSADEPLTIEGTVYSEMLGAMDLTKWGMLHALRDAFPGSTASRETGGLPSDIPDMTWDELKEYHATWYHPSNCRGVLYGNYEDYTAFLRMLNTAFEGYERRDFSELLADRDYTPITEPVTAEHVFAAEAGSDDNHKTMVVYTFVCHDADGQEQMVLNTMTDLLVAESSALSQSVKTELPHATFGCYINTDTPDFSVVFYVLNVNPDEAETFRGLVDTALADVAENGFPQDLVNTIATKMSISSRLIREDANVGVETIVPDTLYYWQSSGNPWDFMTYEDALGQVDDWNQQGLYAGAAAKFLVGSQTTALSVTVPQPGLKETEDAALADRLAEIKGGMTEDQINEIVTASNEGDEDEPDPELIASMQAVSVATLPEEIREYETTDVTDENGVRHINTLASVEGVGAVNIMLDASGVAVEDLHAFKLLMDLVPYLNGTEHTRQELSTLSGLYLYTPSIRISMLEDPDSESGFHLYLRLSWISEDESLETGYGLIGEYAFGLDLDDPQAVLEAVQAVKTSLRSSINSSPYNAIIYRTAGVSNPLYRAYSYINYLDYYAFLEQAEQALQTDPEAFLGNLKRVREQLRNATGAVAMYAGSAEGAEKNAPLADAFLASLNHEPVTPVSYDALPVPAKREALVVDSSVQFNVIQADMETLGLTYSGDLDALNNLVLDMLLYPQLRDQYGAYGVFHQSGEDLGMFACSYRDPNVQETFAVYEQLAGQVGGMELTQDVLDGYILSAYSSYALGSGELAGAVDAQIDLLEKRDPQEKLQRMRELKLLTPEKVHEYAAAYQALAESGVRATAGGAGVIEQNREIYDVVLNPFGVVDASSITLADIAEDDPRYEAVRFAFDEKLMFAPDGVFGVDEPATKGDLACAMYMFGTGESMEDPATATEVLAPYGLTAAGAVDEPLTVADTRTVLANLASMFGAPLDMEFPEDGELTRAGLAEILFGFNNYLEALLGQ